MDEDDCLVLACGWSWKAASTCREKNGYESKGSEASEEQGNDTLDARIWGELQNYIPLQNVHEKLPYEDFFRLRIVSKDWNRVALERLEPKPYFVTVTLGSGDRYQYGILTYDIASGTFSWKPQHYIIQESKETENFLEPFEVEGMIFSLYPDDAHDKYGVFNIHSKMWHIVPSAPRMVKGKKVCGMIVDTSQIPYSFKLIIIGATMNTAIYDSKCRSWSHMRSKLDGAGRSLLDPSSLYATCLCTNGYVYVSEGKDMILVYSMEQDIWTTLQGPPINHLLDQDDCNTYSLGAWEGRIFSTREIKEIEENEDDKGDYHVSVWELVDKKNHKWVEYARTSSEAYGWLYDTLGHRDLQMEINLVTCFCNEYLLLFCWNGGETRTDGLVLFNLATKEWKRADLPIGIVSHEEEY